jgi:DNA-binding MurR/RpiR family transcriptional regulator
MSDQTQKVAESGTDSSTIFVKIQSMYGSLSVTEKRIADFVLNSPEKIMYNSVTQVAEELQVAQSTVTRFTKTIGLQGFQELKIRLAQATERSQPAPDTPEDDSLPMKMAQTAASSLLDVASYIDRDALKNTIDALAAARRIMIYGLGESGPMAQLLKIKLSGLGLMADAHSDIHMQSISAAHLDERDVAVAISQQGSTKDVVAALRAARSTGAKTICITGQSKSPITEVSDIRLVCSQRGMANIVDSFKSKTSILFAIELIEVSLQLSKGSAAEGTMWKTTASILDKLY